MSCLVLQVKIAHFLIPYRSFEPNHQESLTMRKLIIVLTVLCISYTYSATNNASGQTIPAPVGKVYLPIVNKPPDPTPTPVFTSTPTQTPTPTVTATPTYTPDPTATATATPVLVNPPSLIVAGRGDMPGPLLVWQNYSFTESSSHFVAGHYTEVIKYYTGTEVPEYTVVSRVIQFTGTHDAWQRYEDQAAGLLSNRLCSNRASFGLGQSSIVRYCPGIYSDKRYSYAAYDEAIYLSVELITYETEADALSALERVVRKMHARVRR